MKRVILLILVLLPLSVMAQIPAIETLGEEADREKGVEYESVGSFMLGMASSFADKEQRTTFKMLDHIDMIECKNKGYAHTFQRRIRAIIERIGAHHIATTTNERGENEVYAVKRGTTIKHLIILTSGKEGGYAVTAMSGTIPESRLGEIAKLSPPKKK